MKIFWRQNKIAIVVVAYVIIFPVFFYFGFNYLTNQIKNNADNLQREIIDGEMAQNKISKIPEMNDVYSIFKDRDLNVILSSQDEVGFIKRLESLAEETGNKISLKINDSNSDQNAKKAAANGKTDKDDIVNNLPMKDYLDINIEITGSFTGLVNFVHKLENFPDYVNIVSLNLKEVEVEEEQAVLNSQDIFANKGMDKNVNQNKKTLSSVLEAVVYLKK